MQRENTQCPAQTFTERSVSAGECPALGWNEERELVPVLRSPGSPDVRAGRSLRGSRGAHPPLPGDEVNVVSQRRVVSGHVLRGSVLSGVVGLGGVRLTQGAQAHQQAQGEGQSGRPKSLAPQHLRAPKAQRRRFGGSEDTHPAPPSFASCAHPAATHHPRAESALTALREEGERGAHHAALWAAPALARALGTTDNSAQLRPESHGERHRVGGPRASLDTLKTFRSFSCCVEE